MGMCGNGSGKCADLNAIDADGCYIQVELRNSGAGTIIVLRLLARVLRTEL
jgi:hypothetical protein